MLKISSQIFVMGLLWLFAAPAFGGETIQLTNDDFFEFDNFTPDVNSKGEVSWLRLDKASRRTDVWFYDGQNSRSLTVGSFDDSQAYLNELNDRGQVVWFGNNSHFQQLTDVFFYDGNTINQITNSDNPGLPDDSGFGPLINNNGQIVWRGHTNASSGLEAHVFSYNQGNVTQITHGSFDSYTPQDISDEGHVALVAFNAPAEGTTDRTSDIYLYHDGVTKQINDGGYINILPKTNDAGQVAWFTTSGPAPGLILYDGTDTRRLAEIAPEDFLLSGPQVTGVDVVGGLDVAGANQIAWSIGGDIFIIDPHDRSKALQLTNTPDWLDYSPSINSNDQVVWASSTGFEGDSQHQALFYDGVTTKRLDINLAFNNPLPVIADNGDVVWQEYAPNSNGSQGHQIFLYDASRKVTPTLQVRGTLKGAGALNIETSPSGILDIPSSKLIDLIHGDIGPTSLDKDKPTILIVHGMNDNSDVWVKQMGENIKDRLGASAEKYNIAAWDWSGLAKTVAPLLPVSSSPLNPSILNEQFILKTSTAPAIRTEWILNVAATEGDALAKILDSNGYADKELHLIGHSAGGTVIKQAAIDLMTFKVTANPVVEQLTYLDAPFTGDSKSLATWSDSYISTLLGKLGTPETDLTYQLYPLPSLSLNKPHDYSHVFYDRTVQADPDDAIVEFYDDKGFYWSIQGEGWDPTGNLGPRDELEDEDVFKSKISNRAANIETENQTALTVTTVFHEKFDEVGAWASSGNVYLDDGKAVLKEGSPAYLFEDLTIPQDANFFSFDFKFNNQGDGDYLTTHFNDEILLLFPGEAFSGNDFWSTSLLNISAYAGQTGTWTFGLNSVSEKNAEFWIDNLEFHNVQVTTTPEPASMLLFGLGAGALGLSRRFRKKSSRDKVPGTHN